MVRLFNLHQNRLFDEIDQYQIENTYTYIYLTFATLLLLLLDEWESQTLSLASYSQFQH